MKDVQCYELFGGIVLKNHAFSFFFHFQLYRMLKTGQSVLLEIKVFLLRAKRILFVVFRSNVSVLWLGRY